MEKRLHVVGAYFEKNGTLFATRRGKAKYDYCSFKLEFAGGKVEVGETEEEALKRELKEELSLDAEVLKRITSFDFDYPDFGIKLSLFRCEMKSAYTLKEHVEAKWIPFTSLDPEDWLPADRELIEKLKNETRI